MTSDDFSDVYKYNGLQALFFTVFQTSVDLLCKKSYKSSSLLGYFDCFQSNYTVGCFNVNFSGLASNKKGKFCFESNVSIFLMYFFARLQLFRCNVWPTFHPATPYFFVLAQLVMLIACWKTIFFRMIMGNFWERNREREIFRLKKFPNKEAKSSRVGSCWVFIANIFWPKRRALQNCLLVWWDKYIRKKVIFYTVLRSKSNVFCSSR